MNAPAFARCRASGSTAPRSAPPIVHRVLASPGRPLDAGTRAHMEPRIAGSRAAAAATSSAGLGVGPADDALEREADQVAHQAAAGAQGVAPRDFSGVRVHTDAQAAASARAVGALAYTVGQHIVFDGGQYRPGTPGGNRLLAHELTHVVQQGGAQQRLQRQTPPAGPPAPATGDVLSDELLAEIAAQLRNAMEGWGTDEEAIYAALAGRSQDQMKAIEKKYNDLYKRDLIADLQDELTGSELAQLARLVPALAPGARGTPAEQAAGLADVIAAQLDEAMSGPGTDETAVYAALTGRTPGELQAIRDAYQRLTKRDLQADIEDDFSGEELAQALALLNFDPAANRCPATHTIPEDVHQAVDAAWARSGHGGDTVQEHGGRVVSDKDRKRAVRTGSGGSGSISLPGEESGDTTLGTFHTHPYSKLEGSHSGAAFSAADVDNFVAGDQGGFKYIGAGSCNFALVTLSASKRETCRKTDIKERFEHAYAGSSGSFQDRIDAGVKAGIAGCGLCFYRACQLNPASPVPRSMGLA